MAASRWKLDPVRLERMSGAQSRMALIGVPAPYSLSAGTLESLGDSLISIYFCPRTAVLSLVLDAPYLSRTLRLFNTMLHCKIELASLLLRI